jgi:hypothetical protein
MIEYSIDGSTDWTDQINPDGGTRDYEPDPDVKFWRVTAVDGDLNPLTQPSNVVFIDNP